MPEALIRASFGDGNRGEDVRTKLAIKLDKFLEKRFPERRVFLKSDTDTRFIRLKPATQLIAFSSAILLTSWAIIALAIVLMDSIGSGNFRDQAARDKAIYQARLNHLLRDIPNHLGTSRTLDANLLVAAHTRQENLERREEIFMPFVHEGAMPAGFCINRRYRFHTGLRRPVVSGPSGGPLPSSLDAPPGSCGDQLNRVGIA